ncbi:GAF domain/HD domain protein [Desulfosporosinus sp. I2]|uniref:HD-GYP domain-containing protein n=1 Tax=Desulfosporosinus sp. I2 TaxID=1617025 RepID=UPI00061E4F04|nr:HD-GYP domain-containing protein [Desulfosporosinus sp. I2]KJR49126.1 GAF domain/HD domain protein [Desulfosporosinus sp. I2]
MRSGKSSIIDSFQIQEFFLDSVDNVALESKKVLSLSEFLQTLAMALAAKNIETWEHSVLVTTYAVMLGIQLGLSQEEIEQLRIGALLHDIGKIGIRDDILLKPWALTADEYVRIEKHPEIGARILEPSRALHSIIPIALHHHEHYNGKGYPQGLRGEKIPLAARIVSLADAFEAMTSGRLYRRAMTLEVALEEIQLQSGRQFDPYLGQTFVEMIKQEVSLKLGDK